MGLYSALREITLEVDRISVSVSVSASKLVKKVQFRPGFVFGRSRRGKLRFRPKLSMSFGLTETGFMLPLSVLHFIAVPPSQCAVIYAGFMTLIELLERRLFCYTVRTQYIVTS